MRPHLPAAQRGFTLLEVLLTMVILAFGMLGLASLQAKMNVAEAESYQRAQAVILLQDMVDRILLVSRNDPNLATTLGGYVTSGSSPAYVGVSDAQPTASPADTQATRASYDLWQWSNSLKGAAELSGTTKVGAMIGARGCIEQVQAPVPTAGVCTPGIYRVSVAWQGLTATSEPVLDCARTGAGGALSYGSAGMRRLVSTQIVIGLPTCN